MKWWHLKPHVDSKICKLNTQYFFLFEFLIYRATIHGGQSVLWIHVDLFAVFLYASPYKIESLCAINCRWHLCMPHAMEIEFLLCSSEINLIYNAWMLFTLSRSPLVLSFLNCKKNFLMSLQIFLFPLTHSSIQFLSYSLVDN